MNLKNYLFQRKQLIEQALEEILPEEHEKLFRLIQSMRYSLMAGGKRLRPVLVLAAAESVGGKLDDAMPFACALECLHTYSLIHDDLPAMDDDDLRRGRPTCHRQFDEATAILAGDALLTLAFQLAAQETENTTAEIRLAVISQLAEHAGMFGMVGGQMLDLEAENRRIDLAQLQTIHRWKTGALITVACRAGAMLGGGHVEDIDALTRYGRALGLAFQITDDILDEVGDAELLGKNPGSDWAKEKSTYPSLMGLEKARQEAEKWSNEAYQSLSYLGSVADPLRELAQFVITRTH
ncbi:polyprenyl synthetase family protein [Magnetococcales bacterium HHB-1]